MPDPITIEERANVWIVTARGELDYSDCDAFRGAIDRVIHGKPVACVVDLSAVEYLDSSCLGLLLRLHRDYALTGGILVLVPSQMVKGILAMTRLTVVFACARDLGTALEALSRPATGHGSGTTC